VSEDQAWAVVGRDNLLAAERLLRAAHYRSAVSRAYFAGFAAATSVLAAKKVSFPGRREGPAHERLPRMLLNNMGDYSLVVRRRAGRVLNALYDERIAADYYPGISVDRQSALYAVRDASLILRDLGVSHE
jgi:uncharacterized protein (UPF0332 family)